MGKKSEVRGQERSAIRAQQERRGIFDHCAEHPAYFNIHVQKISEFRFAEIAASAREIQRGIGLRILTIAISGFTNKVRFVAPFGQASRKFRQMDRDERRIWEVSAYFSSAGKFLLNSKMRIARS
jgi:hypothetical protein